MPKKMKDYEPKMARLRERKAREEEASAARRKKEAVNPGPSVATVLRQLDSRSRSMRTKQQNQHWGTGPLKEWESEQAPYKVATPDPYEKD
jgi:hypothetical protein